MRPDFTIDLCQSCASPRRNGVNAGSLECDLLERYGAACLEAMVESALNHAWIPEDNDFFEFKISCKPSDVFLAVAAYHQLAEACGYPLPPRLIAAAHIASGKRTINPLRFGICTLGRVCALIVSFSPISLFCAKMYAVSAYTSPSASVRGCCHGIARRM